MVVGDAGVAMQREWEPEDLMAAWTLVDEDWALVANQTEHGRLGFALLLKFFEAEARFPRHVGGSRRPQWTTSPPRSRWVLTSWPSTPGRAGRSSTTGRKFARLSASGRPPGPTRTPSLHG